jgi:hypothetical protein
LGLTHLNVFVQSRIPSFLSLVKNKPPLMTACEKKTYPKIKGQFS